MNCSDVGGGDEGEEQGLVLTSLFTESLSCRLAGAKESVRSRTCSNRWGR